MDIKREIRDKATAINTADSYIDLDGNTRNFTHVDHDVKTKKSTYVATETAEELHRQVQEAKERHVLEILAMPVLAATLHTSDFSRNFYEQFITRGEGDEITWNEKAVRIVCFENAAMAHNLWIHCWRRTVKFDFWWGPYLTHEEMLEGKWKELMA